MFKVLIKDVRPFVVAPGVFIVNMEDMYIRKVDR
jgi:hypothetical protein